MAGGLAVEARGIVTLPEALAVLTGERTGGTGIVRGRDGG